MRVSKIQLTDLGPFDDVTLEIPAPPDGSQGELVLFEGPNGSGKTTLLQSICAALELFFYGVFPEHNVGAVQGRMQGERAHASVEFVGLESAGQMTPISFGLTRRAPRSFAQSTPLAQQIGGAFLSGFQKLPWAPFAYHGASSTPVLSSEGPRDVQFNPFRDALYLGQNSGVKNFARDIGQFLTNLESERTRALVYALERATPEERAVMEARARSQASSLQRVQDSLSDVLGWKVSFKFDIQRQAPTVLFDGQAIPLEHLGEGLRRTFSWLTDLLVRLELVLWKDASRSPLEQEFLLFLDEVDQSLHPTMQMRLMPTLRKLFPRARIYATTHSPFVVASVEEGYVFSIRPDHKTHRVSGVVESQHLQGGRTLESVVNDVFDAPATFIDETSRTELQKHKAQVDALRSGGEIDEVDFMERRRRLHELGEEVWTVVAMREVPARKKIEEIKQRASAREAGE